MDDLDDHSPTSPVGPPSYELSIAEKSSHLRESTRIVDDDGWPIYDQAAFEAVANSYQLTPASSSHAPVLPNQSAYDIKLKLPTSSKSDRSFHPHTKSGRLVPVTPLNPSDFVEDDLPPPFSVSVSDHRNGSLHGSNTHAHVFNPCSSPPASPLASPLSQSHFYIQPPLPVPQVLHAPPNLLIAAQRRPQDLRPPLPPIPTMQSTPIPHRPLARQPVPQPSLPGSRLDFNPRLAYSNHHAGPSRPMPPSRVSEFYNPMVASHMVKPTPTSYGPDVISRRSYAPSMALSTTYSSGRAPDTASVYNSSLSPTGSLPPPASVSPAPSALGPSIHPARYSAGGSIPDVRSSGPQWATSEAQLFRDVYRGL